MGGWSQSWFCLRGFAFAAFRSDDRKKFVGQLVDLCEEEGLEGIEFDWEGGEEELQNFRGLHAHSI